MRKVKSIVFLFLLTHIFLLSQPLFSSENHYHLLKNPLPYYPNGWALHPELAELIATKDVVVEVGSYCGRNALYLAPFLKEGVKLHCIDNFSLSLIAPTEDLLALYNNNHTDWMDEVANRAVGWLKYCSTMDYGSRLDFSSEEKIKLFLEQGGYIEENGKKYISIYAQFLSNLKHQNLTHKVIPHVMTSEEASKVLDLKPDLIYLDADHSYKSTLNDLKLWYPKLAKNGIICGDDYDIPGVQKAVNQFARKHRLKVKVFCNAIEGRYDTQCWNFWMLES